MAPTSIGFTDPRDPGALLWPARIDEAGAQVRARDLGPRAAASQEEQRPMPAGGGIFTADYLRYWEIAPRKAVLIQSWDCAFKDLADSDFVVGQVWAATGGDFYLLDQVRGRWSVGQTVAQVKGISKRWGKARTKLIEDKANGPAVEQLLRGKLAGIRMVTPEGGKEARANAVEPLWAAGNVYLPHPRIAPWVNRPRDGFIAELLAFPGGENDDQVDGMTQALIYLYARGVSRYKEAMEAAKTNGGGLLGGVRV